MATGSPITLKTVGDWGKQIDVPLNNALQATVELMGWSGRKTVEKALVYMARSAAAMTRKAKKNRRVLKDPKLGPYVEVYHKPIRGKTTRKINLYKFAVDSVLWKGGDWAFVKRIGGGGLAKRSWLWNLVKKGKRPIRGVTSVAEFGSENEVGMVLTNRLSYINRAAPGNVEQLAARKATNQIMAQAAKKAERVWGVQIPRLAASRNAKIVKKSLKKTFKATGRIKPTR